MRQGRCAAERVQAVTATAGFTLPELCLSLAVLAILGSICVGSYASLVRDARRSTAVNALLAHLHYARHEAIVRRTPVSLCRIDAPTGSGTAADGNLGEPRCDAVSGGGWEAGWLVFGDRNHDGRFDPAEDLLLRQHPPLAAGSSLRANARADDGVRFSPAGTSVDNGRWIYCDDRGWGRDARVLWLAISGRTRTSEGGPAADPAGCRR